MQKVLWTFNSDSKKITWLHLTHPPWLLFHMSTHYILDVNIVCTHWHCLACSVLSWRHWPTDSSSLFFSLLCAHVAFAGWAGVSTRVTPGIRCEMCGHQPSLIVTQSLVSVTEDYSRASMERKMKPRSLKGCSVVCCWQKMTVLDWVPVWRILMHNDGILMDIYSL